jgi:hypothetical protein
MGTKHRSIAQRTERRRFQVGGRVSWIDPNSQREGGMWGSLGFVERPSAVLERSRRRPGSLA